MVRKEGQGEEHGSLRGPRPCERARPAQGDLLREAAGASTQ